MYKQPQKQFFQLQSDELTDLLKQMKFQINDFGLWESQESKKMSFITSDIEIVYYIKGGSSTSIGDKKYQCPPGSILILEPFQLNVSDNRDYEECSYYYFHFDIEPVYLKQQFFKLLTKHGNVIYPDEIRNFEDMLSRLQNEVENKEIGYVSMITSALMRVVIEIMRAQLKRGEDIPIEKVRSSQIRLINDSVNYIQDHFFETVRLRDLTRELGVSNGALYKAFMNILGVPPGTYIHQQKIQYVQKKLLAGETLTNIAQEAGFCSPYHLSKAFKQMTGLTPKQYRQSMKMMT